MMAGNISGIRIRPAHARVIALTLIALALAPGAASAALSFTIDGTSEFSESGSTFDGSISVTFENNGTDTVKLTIDASGMTGPSTAFISGFYFNAPEDATAAQVTAVSASVINPSPTTVSFDSGLNEFKADGDGFFDYFLDFPTSDGPTQFKPGEILMLNLTADGLTEDFFDGISVNGPVGKTGFPVVARIQGLGTDGEGSGFFNGDGGGGGPVVPEPSTLALAIGCIVPLAAIGLIRRRRQVKADVA